MDTAYIRSLYDFNRWANARLLAVATRLPSEVFTKNLGSSHASIRDTLAHNLGAEWIWLERWKGNSPRALLDPKDFPTVEALRTRWGQVEKDQADFLRSLTDERLQAALRYTTTEGTPFVQPLWQLMAHVVNHSTYHRGQVITLLRQVGAEPVSTDLVLFFREGGAR